MVNIKRLGFIIVIFFMSQLVMANIQMPIQNYFNQWASQNEIVGAALAINDQIYIWLS